VYLETLEKVVCRNHNRGMKTSGVVIVVYLRWTWDQIHLKVVFDSRIGWERVGDSRTITFRKTTVTSVN
jgi:hypothetical protein